MHAERDLGFALGAADYIIKPFDAKALLRTLCCHRSKDRPAHVLVVDNDEPRRQTLKKSS
ncbi:MAG TPA: hypothetical protein PLJ27_06850 [Polyangiaceae bacterium]|jgi:DNA-binding response OmpR family regulator|nr:MAG: hypothetical protein BWY17_03863 [Deltaproteobacteria bacterium ADurb.Bin207]HNS98870.1 hypothetical protein [Polyangiaceae bacterium]HNZ22102.1 hypothetical protein [Polyangiaceae bacterium]HOD21402.1 hypothetical protein [Polyangiaceae bacterium]HOE51408.1 hypothetical protein [Polyangiaceae bacterium]